MDRDDVIGKIGWCHIPNVSKREAIGHRNEHLPRMESETRGRHRNIYIYN